MPDTIDIFIPLKHNPTDDDLSICFKGITWFWVNSFFGILIGKSIATSMRVPYMQGNMDTTKLNFNNRHDKIYM